MRLVCIGVKLAHDGCFTSQPISKLQRLGNSDALSTVEQYAINHGIVESMDMKQFE